MSFGCDGVIIVAKSSPRKLNAPAQVAAARANYETTMKPTASVNHSRRDALPFFFMHNTGDWLVPMTQSEQLHTALQQAGVESTHVPVPGNSHVIAAPPEVEVRVVAFFKKHLRPGAPAVTTLPASK